MYFIGSGGLLHRAVEYCLTNGLAVDGACCPPGDAVAARLRSRGVAVLESQDPNVDLLSTPGKESGAIVFSINNRHIIHDALLRSGPSFFNIHAGMIQQYRGIAEVCMFAALTRGDRFYGVTLHRLLPNQRVDSGPVVAQQQFAVDPEDRFSDLLQKSLDACQSIFESNVRNILQDSFHTVVVDTAAPALSYKDVASLRRAAAPARLAKASDLGRYAGLFSRLAAAIGATELECKSTF
jgi:methionyl-tRNA formyltransferase